MAVKLNLLPQDYAVSGSVATVLKITRPLNIVLLGFFLISALGMAGFFVYTSITLKNLNSANNILKNQIQSQETAQQQVVLLKDRLGKIKKVYAKPGSEKNLLAIEPILTTISGLSSVSELVIDPQETNLKVNFKTNSDLTNFLNNLEAQRLFSNISIESFNYEPINGYLVEFSFVRNLKLKNEENT